MNVINFNCAVSGGMRALRHTSYYSLCVCECFFFLSFPSFLQSLLLHDKLDKLIAGDCGACEVLAKVTSVDLAMW